MLSEASPERRISFSAYWRRANLCTWHRSCDRLCWGRKGWVRIRWHPFYWPWDCRKFWTTLHQVQGTLWMGVIVGESLSKPGQERTSKSARSLIVRPQIKLVIGKLAFVWIWKIFHYILELNMTDVRGIVNRCQKGLKVETRSQRWNELKLYLLVEHFQLNLCQGLGQHVILQTYSRSVIKIK